MNTEKREQRDWTLLIFIIPIGILLIIIVGQMAVRLLPNWSVTANMNSNLEPDVNSARPFALLEPILPQILTPMAWAENYLTPGADVYFPPFLTFEPSATPSPTAATPTETADTPTPVATASPSPAPTSTSGTGTAPTNTPPTDDPGNPGGGGGGGSTQPPATCNDPTANNQGQPLPCTYDPPPPPIVCPGAHNPTGPLPCDYGDETTQDPGDKIDTPDPRIDVNNPPDGSYGNVPDGKYVVLGVSVTVGSTPDNNYDLVFFEYNNGGSVYIDWVIIGITNDSTGATYYEVFNWGEDNTPDMNSNVGDVSQAEGDEPDNHGIQVAGNTEVPPSQDELYDPDYDPGPPETNGPAPQTGILIDVDNAPSDPPPDTYQFVVVISPSGGSSGESAQVDAVQAVEVPTPTP